MGLRLSSWLSVQGAPLAGFSELDVMPGIEPTSATSTYKHTESPEHCQESYLSRARKNKEHQSAEGAQPPPQKNKILTGFT